MDTLAADLQEATSDLLELPKSRRGRATPSATTARPPPSQWSQESKLVVIPSSDDDTASATPSSSRADSTKNGAQTNAPALKSEDEQSNSDNNEALQVGAEGRDRLGSLSSRTPPIRPVASASMQSDTPQMVAEGMRPSPQTPSMSRSRFSDGRGEVWLNELGERIVDGRVVGKLSLTQNGDQSDHENVPSDEATDTMSGSATLDPGQRTPVPRSGSQRDRLFDHTAHGASQRLHTPDFFLRHFSALTVAKEVPQVKSAQLEVDADDEPQQRPSIARRPSPVLSIRSSHPAEPQLAAITSDSITLHGNRRAARQAGEDPTRWQSTPGYAQPSRSGGIAWQTNRPQHRRSASGSRPRASPRTGSFKDRPLLDRASSLFTTPLVQSRAERETPEDEEAANGWEDEEGNGAAPSPVTSIAPALPSPSSGADDGDGDTSSLMSLPASSVTATNSDGASFSRRSSLRRANSSGSAGSTLSSRGRASSVSGEVYARDVRIRGWSEVGTKTRGYVSFEVVVLTKRGVVIHAHRRYSSFAALRKQLVAQVPQHKAALPPLPPKDALHKYSAKHLEQRRLALTDWLQAVILDPRWGPKTRQWLVGPAS